MCLARFFALLAGSYSNSTSYLLLNTYHTLNEYHCNTCGVQAVSMLAPTASLSLESGMAT